MNPVSIVLWRVARLNIFRLFLGIIMITIWGCSSSEGTGTSRSPAQQEDIGPITIEPQADVSGRDSPQALFAGTDDRPQVGDPAIRRGQDTVLASVRRRSRSAAKRQPLVKPPNAMYTVQVGAFRRAPNALSLQKLLKRELSEQLVFNMYAASEGMYRVTIGKFETLREASNYRQTLLKSEPERFQECWVTYIER